LNRRGCLARSETNGTKERPEPNVFNDARASEEVRLVFLV
jgi:hypothetical protein